MNPRQRCHSRLACRNCCRRLAIAQAQQPFAAYVSCSDSRVPPELLFGRGLGELFIIRNAGNTIDTVAQGSIEFAVAELGVPLVVVMGHQRCGAVKAATEVVQKNRRFPGAIGKMIDDVLAANPAIVAEYRAGKEKAFNSLVGQVMKAAKGKANPQQVNELLKQKLA